jgi:hypothetical protein
MAERPTFTIRSQDLLEPITSILPLKLSWSLLTLGRQVKKDLASANLLNNLSRDYQVGSADFSGVNKYLTGDMQTWGVKRSRKDQNYL